MKKQEVGLIVVGIVIVALIAVTGFNTVIIIKQKAKITELEIEAMEYSNHIMTNQLKMFRRIELATGIDVYKGSLTEGAFVADDYVPPKLH